MVDLVRGAEGKGTEKIGEGIGEEEEEMAD